MLFIQNHFPATIRGKSEMAVREKFKQLLTANSLKSKPTGLITRGFVF